MSLPARAELWLVGDPCPLAVQTADRFIARGNRVSRFTWDEAPPGPPAALAGLILLAPPAADDRLPARAFRWLQQAGEYNGFTGNRPRRFRDGRRNEK